MINDIFLNAHIFLILKSYLHKIQAYKEDFGPGSVDEIHDRTIIPFLIQLKLYSQLQSRVTHLWGNHAGAMQETMQGLTMLSLEQAALLENQGGMKNTPKILRRGEVDLHAINCFFFQKYGDLLHEIKGDGHLWRKLSIKL